MTEIEKPAAGRIPLKTALLLAVTLVLLAVVIWMVQPPSELSPALPLPLPSLQETAQKEDGVSPGQMLIDERLGLTLADQGDFAGAADKFTEVVRQRPDDAMAHSRLANTLSFLGENEKAAKHYSEAVRLNHRDQESLKGLALSLGILGKAKEAEEKFRELVKKEPNDANIHYFLGLSLVMQGKRTDAMPSFSQAIQLNPDHLLALNDLAWILATHPDGKMRDGAKAVSLAEHSCRLTEYRNAQFLGTLDACYAETGRFDEAIATAQKAHELARRLGYFDIADAAKKREEQYWQGKPFRDTPPVQK